jgi:hypothetical protein
MSAETDEQDAPEPIDPRAQDDIDFWTDFEHQRAMERDADLPDLADETTTRDEEGDE